MIYLSGKPMEPPLLRCEGLEGDAGIPACEESRRNAGRRLPIRTRFLSPEARLFIKGPGLTMPGLSAIKIGDTRPVPEKGPRLPSRGEWRSLVSALALGARGRRFESVLPDYFSEWPQAPVRRACSSGG